MDQWNLEGLWIEGGYLAGDVKVTGQVTLSRVAYGGMVQHHVKLDKGFSWNKGAVVRLAGETIIVEHPYVYKVFSSNPNSKEVA